MRISGTGPAFRIDKGDGGPGSLQLQGWHIAHWEGTASNRAPEEHTEVRWFEIRQALSLDLAHEEYLRVLSEFSQREEFSL